MSPAIEITKDVYTRLEKHVVGFDNPSNVINRLLDSFEKQHLTRSPKLSSSHQDTANDNNRLFSNKEIQQRISFVAESLTKNELEMLCNERSSNEIFGISFPLFIKVNATANQATKKLAVKSSDGVNRWTWKFEFVRNGFAYAICTQWYLKNDRFVQQWLNSHESKNAQKIV